MGYQVLQGFFKIMKVALTHLREKHGVTISGYLDDKRERERLSLSAFLRTEDIVVHIVHISRLIITYTLE